MDPGNIIDSFLYPTEVIPFEFLFNDHFVLDVNFQVFNYIPYVTSFLFGIFCYLETSNLRFKSGFYDVEHMFNMKGQVDVVKWAWVVKSGDQRQLIFFNFYFGPNFDQSQKQTISELEFSNLMDKLPAGARNIDGTFFYEYYFYHDEPRYYDPVTLKLAVKNPSRSMVTSYSNHNQNVRFQNGSRSKGLLGRAAEEFLAYRDEVSLDKLLYTVDQFWISSRNRSWQSKNNPSKACGFIHGLFFFAQYVQQARLEIYRHQNKDFEKFFLVVYSLAAPAPIYTISFNKGEYVNHYNSETKSEKTSLIPALPSFDQVSRNLEKSVVSEMIVQLHNNGRDYLTNLFENANNITRNEQLMQAFSVYLANIFDEVKPADLKQSTHSYKFLTFFIIGSFVSTETKLYEAFSIITLRNFGVIVFKPKIENYPLIIASQGQLYTELSLQDLEQIGADSINSILVLIIDENFVPEGEEIHNKRFLIRNINFMTLSNDQLRKDLAKELGEIMWRQLKHSDLLNNMMKFNASSDDLLQDSQILIENLGETLNMDIGGSVVPFMIGLLHRSKLNNNVDLRKFCSLWSCYIVVSSRSTDSSLHLHFIILAMDYMTEMFLRYPPAFLTHDKVLQIACLYKLVSLQSTVAMRKIGENTDIAWLAKEACEFYDYEYNVGKQDCPFLQKKPGLISDYEYFESILLDRSLTRRMKIIGELEKMERERSLSNTNHMRKKRSLKDRIKKYRPIVKTLNNEYQFAKQIKSFYDNAQAIQEQPSVETAMNLLSDSLGLAKTIFDGAVKLARYLKFIKPGLPLLGPIGAALGAVSAAFSIVSTGYSLVKKISDLQDVVDLTLWEFLIESTRIINGLDVSEYNQMRKKIVEGKNANYANLLNITRDEWPFLDYDAYIGSYICAENADCSGSVAELDLKRYTEYVDSRYYTQFNKDQSEAHILCVDEILLSYIDAMGKKKNSSKMSYFCKNAFALIKSNTNDDDDVIPKALYHLGPQATVRALARYSNHFHINANFTLLEGGEENDFFEFTSMLQCGHISGSGGNDTIKLGQMISGEYELIISANSIDYKRLNETKSKSCVKMDTIERVVGVPNRTETIHINNCIFDMISLDGGTPENPDNIYISSGKECVNELLVILNGPSYLENNTTLSVRRFFYRVSGPSAGNITILLHAYWGVEHSFVLDFTPLYDMAIVEMVNKAPLLNEIQVVDKNQNILKIIVNGTTLFTNLIFKDGEIVEFQDSKMFIKVDPSAMSVGTLLHKYSNTYYKQNAFLHFESERFGFFGYLNNESIAINTIYEQFFNLFRIPQDAGSFSIHCRPGHNHILPMMNANFSGGATIIKIFPQKNQPAFLAIDFTHYLADLDKLNFTYEFNMAMEKTEYPDDIKVTFSVKGKNLFLEVFIIHLIKFPFLQLVNAVMFYTTSMYTITKNDYVPPKIDIKSYDPAFSYNKLAQYSDPLTKDDNLRFSRLERIYTKATQNHIFLQTSNTQWNDVIVLWGLQLENLQIFRVGDSVVVTNLVSNFNQAFTNQETAHLMLIIEDFYCNAKMRSLILKDSFDSSFNVSLITNGTIGSYINFSYFTFHILTYSELVEQVRRIEDYRAWRYVSTMENTHDQSTLIHNVILPRNQRNVKQRQKPNIKLLQDVDKWSKAKYEIAKHESILD